MPIWPFKRPQVEDLTPEQLRDRLIAAASGPTRKLRAVCEQYKNEVAAHVDLMRKVPEAIRTDRASLDRHMQRLIVVAQCLANECGAPELWNALCGTPDNNVILQWQRWYSELPQRMERLEYDQLIAEARSFLEQAKSLQGNAVRQNEAFLLGRLGELLFNSGKVSESIGPMRSALAVCREIGDAEGEFAYLNNLLEAHRYCGDVAEVVSTGEELIRFCERHGKDAGPVRKRVQQFRAGEPLCRVVCARDGVELELDEITGPVSGRYEFRFKRNRLPLQRTEALTRQGNTLASAGQLADALEKYQAASEVDPHDPDPLYQSGTCLLHLGAYARARETFEEVERLAPGWFHCRSDRWLAEALENGTISDEEFQGLRALEDGGLDPATALEVARKAIDRYPNFAPFYLILGNLQRDRRETEAAIASYRDGLERVAEPDLESRLLCALAALLPKESPERQALIERALSLKGNLVAQASSLLMNIH